MNSTINDALDRFTPDGDFLPSEVVLDAYSWLKENEPGALEQWMDLHCVAFLNRVMSERLRKRRRAQTFTKWAVASERFESETKQVKATGKPVVREDGDDRTPGEVLVQEVSIFRSSTFVIDDAGTRRPLGDMTGTDFRYVASDYESSAKVLSMEAHFHRAMAKKVGKKKLSDVMDEEKYVRLRDSIFAAA